MEGFSEFLSSHFHSLVHIISTLVELAGLVVIVVSVARALIGFFRKDQKVKIELGNGLMLGIEIMIGAEVFHTLVMGSMQDLAFLGIIVVIRVILTFVLHWEVTAAEKEEREQEEGSHAPQNDPDHIGKKP